MEFSSIRSWLLDFIDIFDIFFNEVYVYEIIVYKIDCFRSLFDMYI